MTWTILEGDVLDQLRTLPDEHVQCVVTSPPYWGLRDYGVDGQIGLEESLDEHMAKLVEVFREVRRVLRSDGVAFVNYGDAYAAGHGGSTTAGNYIPKVSRHRDAKPKERPELENGPSGWGRRDATPKRITAGLKPKDLIGMPWMLAFALRADGWWLRSEIIWCLSGGTWLYVRTQKGDMPMTVKDVARLDPSTVQLWNGTHWTRLLGMNRSPRRGDELEIVLRSGERISCTPTHRFPTAAGCVVEAANLKAGDVLMRCQLPEPEATKDCAIDDDAAWFAGLYLAEGSRSGDTIQIAGHAKESERWERVQRIATKFGGSATMTEDGNNQAIRVYGKMLNAILAELVTGRTSHDKGFAPVVWRYSNRFIAAMVDGYLSGDGHADGARWRLGFCRNYNLERDLRTACARLGYTLTLNLASVEYDGRRVPTFRGELRKERSGHCNERDRNEIIEIRKARCREVYDLGVADEPHLFALASGVLTHNSKPNPMPESCRDRPTKAHEPVFLLSKSARYFWNREEAKDPASGKASGNTSVSPGYLSDPVRMRTRAPLHTYQAVTERNYRTVWTIATQGTPEAHFATFPEELVERCIKAGSRKGDIVLEPFAGSGTTLLVAERLGRDSIGIELNPAYVEIAKRRISAKDPMATVSVAPGVVQRSLFQTP